MDLVFFVNSTCAVTATHKSALLSKLQQDLLVSGRASAVFQAPNAIKIKGMQTTGSMGTDVDVLLVPNLLEENMAIIDEYLAKGLGGWEDDPRMIQLRAAIKQHWCRWVWY